MPRDLRGLPIAITGASSGIGEATAILCARAGMPVALAARRIDRLEALATRIASETGVKAVAVACDVSRRQDCERFIDEAARAFGGLHAVFANAGYGISAPAIDDPNAAPGLPSEAKLRAVLETNFFGTIATIRPALVRFRAAGKGHVLVCSSCLSKVALPHLSAYTISKAAQDHLVRALRVELQTGGARAIHVSSVHPIGTRTELFDVAEKLSGDDAQGPAIRTPPSMMQPASTVARAIVRCLRAPKSEVWTSTPARLAMALGVAMPGVRDWVLARQAMRGK
jgi:short-subunit dehydrogenase